MVELGVFPWVVSVLWESYKGNRRVNGIRCKCKSSKFVGSTQEPHQGDQLIHQHQHERGIGHQRKGQYAPGDIITHSLTNSLFCSVKKWCRNNTLILHCGLMSVFILILSFIYSFIHSVYFYSASSSPLLLRGAPDDYSIDTVMELTHLSATGKCE